MSVQPFICCTEILALPLSNHYAFAFLRPFLINKRRLRAFAFWNVPNSAPIAPLASLNLSGTNNFIQLAWTDHPTEQYYVLERRRETEPSFTRLVQLPANTITYTDSSAQQSGQYRYRLRAVTDSAETTIDESITFDCQTGQLVRSIHSGNWQQTQTWQCDNVPTSANTVQILTNQSVTVSRPETAARLILSGSLIVKPGGTIRLAASE